MQKRLRLRYLINVMMRLTSLHKATQKSALAPTPRADSSFIGQLKPEQINEGPSKGDGCIQVVSHIGIMDIDHCRICTLGSVGIFMLMQWLFIKLEFKQ